MTIYIPQNLDPNLPLYKAVAQALERDIFSGKLQPGTQLPPHRGLADALEINVSTVSRAYKAAREKGLLSGTTGRGTFVTTDVDQDTALMPLEPSAPGMIEMGQVIPLCDKDPDMGKELATLARSKGINEFFRYTDPTGLAAHRKAGVIWANTHGMPADPQNILVTAGAQHALTCTLMALFSPGDRIAVETLTYPGMKSLAQMLHIQLVPVAMDDQGMIPDDLNTACKRTQVKGIFLMPSCQNPTTSTMSLKRRRALADLIQCHGLILMEDDTYGLTRPERLATPTKEPPIATLVPEQSIFIAALSKAFLPGLRTAFVVVPTELHAPMAQAILNTIWMAPTLNAALAANWITTGRAHQVLLAKQREAAYRRDWVLKAFEKRGLPHPRGHRGSVFLWSPLPPGCRGQSLEDKARAQGVNLFCAHRFAVGSAPIADAIRISLTGARHHQELEKGIRILLELIKANKD